MCFFNLFLWFVKQVIIIYCHSPLGISEPLKDLIKVAKEYGKYYCLQDYQREDGLFDISIIKSNNGIIEYYTENNGKIWEVSDDINLVLTNQNKKIK